MLFEWGWCETCRCAYVHCPKCGNNCCNGTHGKDAEGKECDVCPLAYQFQDLACETERVPTKLECKYKLPDAMKIFDKHQNEEASDDMKENS